MKTDRRSKGRIESGFALILAVLVASTVSAQTQSQSNRNADRAFGAKSADAPLGACAQCKTEAYEEFTVKKVADEYVTHVIGSGLKHVCGACGGRITYIAGQTHSAMMDYCATCSKAQPTCCTKEGHRQSTESSTTSS